MSLLQSSNRKLEHVVESQKKELERQEKELEGNKRQNDKVQRDLKDEITNVRT